MAVLLKAGFNASVLNPLGISTLDVCLLEMRRLSGPELTNWFEIAIMVASRSVKRSKFTTTLLDLQKDKSMVKKEWHM